MKVVCGGILILAGIIILGVGAGLGWGFFPGFIEDEVIAEMSLTDPESEGYQNFMTPPVPWYMKFYLFNVDNPAEVAAGQKPKFTEKGPYSYKEKKMKVEVSQNLEDNWMKFGQYRSFEFDSETSCEGCTKDDQVTILNLVLLGALGTARKSGKFSELAALSSIGREQADYVANVENLFMFGSVDNILFSGMKDGFLDYLVNENTFTKARIPPQITENGFAVMNPKNGSTFNECYKVTTDSDVLSEILEWGETMDYMNETLYKKTTCSTTGKNCMSWWPKADYYGFNNESSFCNQITGTNKEQFHSNLDKEADSKLWIFVTDLCRSLYVNYREEVDIDGITAWRYSVPVDGGWVNKTENVCFCDELSDYVKRNNSCVKTSDKPDELDISECEITDCFDGMMNLFKCMYSPLFFSSPHFYLSESMLQQVESGLSPNPELHETVLDVEPITGMSLRGHSRIQINMPVIKSENTDKHIPLMKNVMDFPAFPVLWLDEGAEIDQENIDKLKSKVFTPMKVVDGLKYTSVALGPIMLLIGAFLIYRGRRS